MRPLWVAVVAGAGRGRAALVVASTAVVTGLLLVAVSYARLGSLNGYDYAYPAGDARLLGPIADPGTRGGSILAVVLVTLPVVLLLDQCVRLGSAVQQQRYRALTVAGATRGDLRRWGALETGVPALVGAVLGVPVWLLLRLALGHGLAHSGHETLVPTVTGPGWWALLVIAVVGAYGVWVGRRAAVRAVADTRRALRQPRPWGVVLLPVAVVLLVAYPAGAIMFPAVLLAVLAFMTCAPWVAFAMSGRVSRRTGSAAELLASRRIRADHGAAGRAAAAIAGVGLAMGVLGVFIADLFESVESDDLSYYLVPSILVGVLALLALGVITLSLTLHSVEATLARRREVSALVATGIPFATLEEATRAECRLVTLPLATAAGVVGVLASFVLSFDVLTLLGGVVGVVLVVVGVLVAAQLAAALTRPYLLRAVAVDNLRTD